MTVQSQSKQGDATRVSEQRIAELEAKIARLNADRLNAEHAFHRAGAERECYRSALEQIAGHFVEQADGTVKTYAGPIGTLYLIRQEAMDALEGEGRA